MTRLFLFAGVVLAAVLALDLGASGQEPNARSVPMLVPQPGASVFPLGRGLPGYPTLQMEAVQKELGLTPEQKEKLKEIAKKAAESMREEPGFDWTKFRDMKPEEQRKAQKERADRYAKQAEETKKQVEQVLTPKQVEQLKDMDLRQRVASMLYMPQVLQQVELPDEQKQQMKKIREDTQSKMAQLQRESQEKLFNVLTPEQKEKLKELSGKGWTGWGRPGPLWERTDRPKDK
jgi:Spy/CpxP family protein refolding chaperone